MDSLFPPSNDKSSTSLSQSTNEAFSEIRFMPCGKCENAVKIFVSKSSGRTVNKQVDNLRQKGQLSKLPLCIQSKIIDEDDEFSDSCLNVSIDYCTYYLLEANNGSGDKDDDEDVKKKRLE